MADRPKREIKEPEWFYNEFSAYTPVKKANPQRKDTKLYDIEVTEVDKANKRLKIHYVGYSSRFDEWRPFGRDEKISENRTRCEWSAERGVVAKLI